MHRTIIITSGVSYGNQITLSDKALQILCKKLKFLISTAIGDQQKCKKKIEAMQNDSFNATTAEKMRYRCK